MIERQAGPTLTGQAVRARGTVVPQFLARHALSAADAIAFVPQGEREAKAFAALVGTGAVREARAGAYYLDLPRYRVVEEVRSRRLARFAIAGSVVVALLAMLFYRG